VVPPAPERLSRLGEIAKQRNGEEEKVVEIAGPRRTKRLLVPGKYVRSQHGVVVGAVLPQPPRGDFPPRVLRAHQAVLPPGDRGEDSFYVVGIVTDRRRDVNFLGDDPSEQRELVAGPVDREPLRKLDEPSVLAQDPSAQRMEGRK